MSVVSRISSALESPQSRFDSIPLFVEEEVEIVGECSDRRLSAVVKLRVRYDEFEIVSESVTIRVEAGVELVAHRTEIHRVEDDVEIIESACFDGVDGSSEQQRFLVLEKFLEDTLARSDIVDRHTRSLCSGSFRNVNLRLVFELLRRPRFFGNVERKLFERCRCIFDS